MRILGINRAELVVADPDREADTLESLLGFRFHRSETPEHGVLSRTDMVAGLELAGPSGAESVMHGLLEQQGEGLLTIVFRVDSIASLLEHAERQGLEVVVDLDEGDSIPGYSHYRQVSLRSDRFPANASFTFAEYEVENDEDESDAYDEEE